MHKFSLGCDPELFLVGPDGGLVSSIGKIGGSKVDPRPIDGLPEGYGVQEDNVALEFNTPPAENKETFVGNIGRALSSLRNEISMQMLEFSPLSAAAFPVEQLMDPAAQEFGCDPDFNAWTGKRNPRPSATDPTLRSCGGHVHVGYKFNTKADAQRFIRYMDLFMGVPSVIMDNGELRKELYGKHGAFRFKPYGVEYRTLSNFWIQDPKLIEWVWDSVELAMTHFDKKDIDIDNLHDQIASAIDNNDKALAQQLIQTFNCIVVK